MDHNKISLNVHLQVPSTTATPTTQDGSHTPNTPEILNTIVNMTSGPFAPEFVSNTQQTAPVTPQTSTIMIPSPAPPIVASPLTPMAPSTFDQIISSSPSPMEESNPVYSMSSPTHSSMTASASLSVILISHFTEY